MVKFGVHILNVPGEQTWALPLQGSFWAGDPTHSQLAGAGACGTSLRGRGYQRAGGLEVRGGHRAQRWGVTVLNGQAAQDTVLL